MRDSTVVKEPLFHITKRDKMKTWNKVLVYAVSIFVSLFLGGVICSIAANGDPFLFFISLFEGVFGSERKLWVFLQNTSLLLCVSMALVPAFKMKFWNLGGYREKNSYNYSWAWRRYKCWRTSEQPRWKWKQRKW